MNDIHWIKQEKNKAEKAAVLRGLGKHVISKVLDLYSIIHKYRETIENFAHQNRLISDSKELTNSEKKEKTAAIKKKRNTLEIALKENLSKFRTLMDYLPNLQLADLNNKALQSGFIVVKTVGETSQSKETHVPHWEIYKTLNLVNFTWGVKVGGTRFVTYVGKGARLRRAIINYQADMAIKNGYTEVLPPLIATNESMYNSGHFPKFKEDVFQIADKKHSLVGTTETSICNFFAGSIIKTSELPLSFSATSINFRSEVGSVGKDVKGCNRMKQFTKTELFSFCRKEELPRMFNKMIADAETILNELGLTYRIIQLSHQNVSFAAQKTYDLEVWMPGENTYKEISSISQVGDFQARRAKIRYRESMNEKTRLCHTLNGTGVAVDRLMACIAETYYNPLTKTLRIPSALIPYFGSNKIE